MSDLKSAGLPAELKSELGSAKERRLLVLMSAVVRAGNEVVAGEDLPDEAVLKGDEFVGHHAIITRADVLAQTIILETLLDRVPDDYFIAEEKAEDPRLSARILTAENFLRHLGGEVFGVDAVDGSSQHDRLLSEWSVSVGLMEAGVHTMGAIYAPDVRGGLLVIGARDHGAYVAERGKPFQKVVVERGRAPSDAMLNYGVDFPLFPEYDRFLHNVSHHFRTTKSVGSCALGLALVACGRVDVLVQPTQRAWDWFAGRLLVEEAGGKVQFYKIRERGVILVKSLQPEDYDPTKKDLGLVAGVPKLVDELSAQLIQQYGS